MAVPRGTGVPPVVSSAGCVRQPCEETRGQDAHATTTRRELLRSLACGGAVAALGAIAAKLLSQSSGSPGQGQACISEGSCRDCGQLDACILPQAMSARKTLSK
jgi:hypothetical protein